MSRYDIVLLDADNTLFDFDAAEHTALARALEERGYPATPESEALYLQYNLALWAAFDRGEVKLDFLLVERFRQLSAALGGSDDPVAFNRDYLTYLGEDATLIPGALELCQSLVGAGCRLALATNGVARVQWARLKASPIALLLEEVFISEELGVQKPQTAFFQCALARMGATDLRRTVMVGDGLQSDIRGGIGSGMDTIWYNPKGLPPQPDVTPTYTAAALAEVRRLILGE